MSDLSARIADLSPEKRELLLRRMSQKRGDVSRPQIPRQPRESNVFPLSFAQQRLWFLDQLDPGAALYNFPVAMRLAGPLDIPVLERGLNEIARRHEVLRTTFSAPDGTPAQVIAPALDVPLPVTDLQPYAPPTRESEVERLVAEEAQRPFDLARGPLLRARLLRLDEQEHVLLLTMHHIISDGWSMIVFMRELGAIYAAFAAGQPAPLPDPPVQYADYAVWQCEWLQGAAADSQRAYWKQRLADAPPVLDLPLDRPRAPLRTFRGARHTLLLPKPLSEALGALSRQEEVTLFMTLLAAFKVLLRRYSGQDDVVVGSPIAGRTRGETEGLIGCFLNTLVLRTDLSGAPTFRELLGRVREVCLEAYAHQDLPFEKLLEELQPERDLSHTPLFQVFFNMLNFFDTRAELPGLTFDILAPPEIGSKFDLTLYVEEKGQFIQLDVVYNADLFEPARMEELVGQLHYLLQQVVEQPEERIDRFSLVTPAARARLPDPTEPLDVGWAGSVQARFSEQARRVPEREAVADSRESWTYAELDAWSSRLANYLRAQGIQPQDAVAIYGHRSAELVWALLGVLKAGAAFTVLDPAYPAARLIDYIQIAQPRGWIRIEAAGPLPPALESSVAASPACCQIALPHRAVAAASPLAGYSIENPGVEVGPDDLAYIAFTSGSTGRPKGILGTHRPLAHFFQWHHQTFGLTELDRFSMLSGLAHDPVLRDIFTPLWLGATLHIPDQEAIGDPGRLAEWMRQSEISVAHLTPALGHLLSGTPTGSRGAATLPSLRYVFFGGDRLTQQDVANMRAAAPAVTCVNFYGATETPQAMGYFVVPSQEDGGSDTIPAEARSQAVVPVGRGIKDVQLLVLNAAGQIAGIGEVGEIAVRTHYLARGYRGADRLSQERFIPDPFRKDEGGRMKDETSAFILHPSSFILYKTGDLGRYLPDGNVAFCGRADQQVKVRGFRIELNEIETALSLHPDVREAVLVAREDVPGEKRLVAYIVSATDKQTSRQADKQTGDAADSQSSVLSPQSSLLTELRVFLRARLPGYMVPAAFVLLDALPLTPNGKIDRRALPKPDGLPQEAETGYLAPQSEMERAIAAIWREVLHVGAVGLDDNFFDLGGSSLHIVQVQSKLRDRLDRDVPIVELFTYPTVGLLAKYLVQERAEQPSFQDVQDRVARQNADRYRQPQSEGIAIVGMSGRFPGARTIDDFWRNLCDGVESIAFFSDQELEAAGVQPAALRARNFVRAGAVLDDVESFDASFFGYTPREAELIDPQHRLFLECAWEALESAGYDPDGFKGWIGVYGGTALNGYLLHNLYPNSEAGALKETVGNMQMGTAIEGDYLTTRVSYKLNLRGPSIDVQTACSTSLVATHLACQSLLSYQCDMALAGGASARIPHKSGYQYQEGGVHSPDGHCRTFDARAGGTIFGSGVGVVVLKRLADAIADGDEIYAVIRGTAINNDGALKVGFTAPSVDGQAAVIALAQRTAGADPETIGYVEAHGTATPMGDPIEVAALTQVFRAGTEKKGFCAIGSVKSNIGHAGAAAGVAGLIKTALALKHAQIPPSLHFEQPNPKIDFANSPFYVNTTLSEWKSGGAPRRAGVSSFGIGGTNAHAVLEEAPPALASGPSRPWQLLVLSARSEAALEKLTDNLAAHLKRHPDLDLADAAYTLQIGRRSFGCRRMLVCRDLADAARALEARDPRRVVTLLQEQRDRPVVFMFSGQGAQYENMARDLYATEPLFRETVDRCAELLAPHLGLDLRDVIFDDQRSGTRGWGLGAREQESDPKPQAPSPKLQAPIDATEYAQPALFVVEYALAQLWMSWGIRPQAMIGHSVGEYVAACLAGVFSLEDALALVAARGRLMQRLPGGAMLTVSLPEPEVRSLLGERLALAAINGPSRCVVSGPTGAVEALERQLAAAGVDCRRLHTSHAFHSPMMEPILEPFARRVQQVPLQAPSIPYLSNVTGTWIAAEEATDPRYWARHLRGTVRFADGIRTLLQEPDRVLLEVGPGQTLTTFARQHPDKSAGQVVLPSLRHPQDQQPDVAFLLHSLGQLWLAGARVDWLGLYAGERRRRLPLPTYPFERQRYWIDPPAQTDAASVRRDSSRKKSDIADWFYIPSWKQSIPPVPALAVPAERRSCWLVFQDSCGLGAQLAKRLEQEGRDVVIVTAGQRFGRSGERAYTIDPRRREDYDSLLAGVRASHARPEVIAHLWNVTPNDPAPAGGAALDRTLDLSFYSLLFLAQALGQENATDPLRIEIVSNNMQEVAREAALCPEKAALLGPCKVIPQEYPNITCQSIDVVLPAPGTIEAEELVDLLAAELAAGSPDRVIAYRGVERWVRTFEAVRLDEAIGGKTRLREGGVYLITGGLGGIGLTLAEHLAEAARAKLVLVGRSAFPAREGWDGWLAAHDERDGVSGTIRKLRALEALGAEILVVSADVAAEAGIRAVIAGAHERFGALHGVIHAAGVAGGGLIHLKTPEMAARVLAPKVPAIRALEAALAGARLDFLVLCSSTAAIAGGIGQIDYCAANAFLDAYARYNTRRGIFTVSIDWDTWREVGMAANMAAAYGLRDAAPAHEAIDHPLFDTWTREASNREIYRARLDAARHWVLSEHKIMGTSALPGTAYLEMARAAFENHAGAGAVELREVFFLAPLMVGAGEQKEVHTILEGAGEVVEFRVVSRSAPTNGVEPKWQEHARGKIGRPAAPRPERYDLEEIIARCGAREITVTEEDFERAERLVYWGPRWRTLKKVSVGTNEGLGVIELPEAFAADLKGFTLHPALLDVATAFANGIVGDGANYLPLSYGGVKIKGALSRKIYSHVRYKDSFSKKETISFAVTITDEHGQELVEIDDFTMKRVNDPSAMVKEPAGSERRAEDRHALDGSGRHYEEPSEAAIPSRAGHGGDTSSPIGILPKEGVEAFKRILSRNRLPQIVVSTRDLHTAIERANTLAESRILEEIDNAQRRKPAHARPDVRTAYVAPGDEVEQRIADIWQNVLGISQVGIHDNFFELGGDSVLSIQIIARAAEAGFQLTPAQLFQYQTVAELARAARPAQVLPTAAEVSAGPFPLTPIQHWFFAQDLPAPQHWNQALLLTTQPPLLPALLARALQHLLRHHPALRLRFTPAADGWQQTVAPTSAPVPLTCFDLSALPAPAQAPALTTAASALQASLDLADGPLLRLALFDLGPSTPARLLLLAHHLVVDAVSWGILLDDLASAYAQLQHGANVALPPTSTPFQHWAARLPAYAESATLRQEAAFWLALAQPPLPPLPRDQMADPPANSEATARAVRRALSAAETSVLLEQVPQAYQTHLVEVLLTALVEALAPWTGSRALLLDIEENERAGVFEDVDLSRTVGWFTALFPLRLDLSGIHEPGAALKAVKEQLRQVPRRGVGYGVLRYLSADAELRAALAAQPAAEVSFTYLGELDQALPAGSGFALASESAGAPRDGAGRRAYLLELNGRVAEGQLRLEWVYSTAVHRAATVERLAEALMVALRDLIAHCLTPDAGGYTPSDFPEAGLSQEDLDRFMTRIRS